MTVASELAWQPAHRLAELVRSGDVSSAEVVEAFLTRIGRIDETVHSFITVAAEQARRGSSNLGGCLAGVPFSAKDNIFTAGVRTTMGSLLFDDFVPSTDASVVRRVTGAGGVLVGKANLPELSSWGRSLNRVAQECVNPWDPTRTAGASSGGSGAAVAAGLVPLSIGSDDGGSIRLPAALNGVFGFKPGPRVVPMDGTVVVSDVAAVGPLTRDVRDAAVFVDLVGDHHFEDGLDDGVAGLRVAWVQEHVGLDVFDPLVAEVARAGAFAFAEVGAWVEDPGVVLVDSWGTARGDVPRYGGVHVHELPEFAAIAADPTWRERLAPYADPDLVAGTLPPRDDLAEARARGVAVVDQLHGLLAAYDLVLTPTIDQVAPVLPDGGAYPYGRPGWSTTACRQAYIKYTSRVNAAGCPAASVPCGFVDGLPVGLQIIGRPGEDATVLRASRAFEQVRPWSGHRPPLAE